MLTDYVNTEHMKNAIIVVSTDHSPEPPSNSPLLFDQLNCLISPFYSINKLQRGTKAL